MKLLMEPGDYFGTTSQKKQINNIILSETCYQGHQKIPNHYHRNFYICYVVKGQFSEVNQNRGIVCNSGDIVIHPANAEHSNEFHHHNGICFNIELTSANGPALIIPRDKTLKLSNPILTNCIKKTYGEFRFDDTFSDMIIEGLVLETLGYVQRQSKYTTPYWLKKAKEIIHDQRDGLSISYLSKELRMSPSHLCREFKKSFGLSIGEYIQHLRITEACKMLKASNAGLLEIALDTGFADQSHFTRTFKKLTGLTPGQYRSIIKQAHSKTAISD